MAYTGGYATGYTSGGVASALGGVGSVRGAGTFAVAKTGQVSGDGTASGGGTTAKVSSLAGVGTLTAAVFSLAFQRTSGLTGRGVLTGVGATATYEQYVYTPSGPPDVTHRVQWRYIAQNILTGQFLNWELPLATDGPQWDLSGPGSLRGTIKPENAGSVTVDTIQEWSTAVYAEADGQIRWGGLVVRSTFNASEWTIECAGFTAYPAGIPYQGPLYSKITQDPSQIFADIWGYVQAQPDGDIGVTVVNPETPVRVGIPTVPGYVTYRGTDAKFHTLADLPAGFTPILNASSKLAVAVTSTSTVLTLARLDHFDQVPVGSLIHVDSEDVKLLSRSGLKLTVQRAQNGTTAGGHGVTIWAIFDAGTPTQIVDPIPAEPYVLAWFNTTDCGQELDRLAQETPFDYTEEHYWQTNGTVGHRVKISYPRAGTRQNMLAFVQGVNVVDVVQATRDGDRFANHVIGIGKGEGALSLRSEVATRDGRLRRVAVYTDKAASTAARVSTLARREMARRALVPAITSISVVNHPNAPIGSWQVGDDILVRADLPWLGWVEVWCRVVSWALAGENRATLSLQRSDTFNYGPVPQ